MALNAHPDSLELLLRLGRLLSRRADEVESNFQDRVEASGYLDRAVRINSHDPRVLLEYGLLLRKQRKNVDALRVLNRAEDAARAAAGGLSPSERADLHEQMALLYEMWWEDWATVGYLPEMFLSGQVWCGGADSTTGSVDPLVGVNFACHRTFNEIMRRFVPMEDLKEGDRAAMVVHFQAAVEADPSRVSAALRLLRWLADWNKWDQYLTQSRALTTRRPDDAEAWLFLGLGCHEQGRSACADSAFARALVVADPDLHATLLDVGPLLPRRDSIKLAAAPPGSHDREVLDEIYWAARDPLYLTPENERRSEHFARVAYADLAFSAPTSNLPGRWSDRGRVWIWYGRPTRIRTIIPSRGLIKSQEAGRVIFWAYGDTIPDLVFHRQLTYRYATHNDESAGYLATLRASVPEWYHPAHPKFVDRIPLQIARFRRPDGQADVEVYASLPTDSLNVGVRDTVQTGLFIFALDPWREASAGRRTLTTRESRLTEHFTATLSPGSYVASVEALGNDRASKGRDSLPIPVPRDELAISDILLADRVVAQGNPRTRHDLGIEGSPTLQFSSGSPVSAVWEVYGLKPDSSGQYHYQVTLETRTPNRGVILNVLRALTFQGNNAESKLEWTVQRPATAGEATLDYATIRMDYARPGPYRMVITITDLATGATTSAERLFTKLAATR